MSSLRFLGGMHKNLSKSSLTKKAFHFENRIGDESVNDFFLNMKELKKSVQREEHLKEPQTAYLV